MPPEKRKQLEERVESRVQHGYSEDEIREWLTDELDVSTDEANDLVQSAFRGKKRAARIWATAVLLLCTAGILFGLKLLVDFILHKSEMENDQAPIRTLLFGICFILMGSTGVASCLPKLLPRKKSSLSEG